MRATPAFLHLLAVGQRARVSALGAEDSSGTGAESKRVVERLMEFGFVPGESVEILHQAPFSGDPIAVRVRGATISLRRAEAALVQLVPNREASDV